MGQHQFPGTIARSAATVLDAMPQMVLVGFRQKKCLYANRAWCVYTGASNDEWFGDGWLEHVHPEEEERAIEHWRSASRYGNVEEIEYRIRDRNGSYRWFSVASGVANHTNYFEQYYFTYTEVDKMVAAHVGLEEKARLRSSMLDASVDCIKLIGTDGALRDMNRSGCEALGVPLDETEFGMKWLDRLPPEVRDRGGRALGEVRRGRKARFAGMSALPGQKPQYWDNILTPMKDEAGEAVAILCVSRDVTLQRVAERRLRRASEVDHLTGLWNRRTFRARLQRSVAKARETGGAVGLLLVDLDHFKHVNDTLGHAAGDHLLRTLARRLKVCAPGDAYVARLGGDEFAIVAPGVRDERDLLAAADTILRQIEAPISYGGKLINGGMSVGCAIYPNHAGDVSGLMKAADAALHHLKSGGRGGAQLFDAAMMERAIQMADQLSKAREIVREDVIVPYYQPRVRLSDGKIVGLEALLRWRDRNGALQYPGAIAEAFNDYELASKIADSMHARVFADIAKWLRQGRGVVPVSINAAPVEFLRDNYAERLLDRLKRYQIPPALIQVEVTEQMLVGRGFEFVSRALRQMKNSGIRIALDDFGTGHFSFMNLRDYPVDTLKVDHSFVRSMMDDPKILAIIQAICMLGPRLSLKVVAEGVETQEQSRVLSEAGCGFGQGFLFSDAVSFEKITAKLSAPCEPRNGSGAGAPARPKATA